ncbi:DUF6153 family protein [Nocardia africana]|uniref:DUF6153 family protein n=1 Tax=Nocardia africana TaxID=134964 RepID=UPI001D152D27|nr:DUF6153 family protein [Nocardia africana]MCC3318376.1 DUF6153 family protein [Nocardia africana]
MLSLFVLLCGLAAMHAGVTAAEVGGPDRVDHSMSMVSVMLGEHAEQHHAHEGGAPHQHSATHLCVFVLTDAVGVAALVLFFWLAVTGWSMTATLAGWRRLRRRHPPPWRSPSLAELSILRI